jgi:ribosomal protein L39E
MEDEVKPRVIFFAKQVSYQNRDPPIFKLVKCRRKIVYHKEKENESVRSVCRDCYLWFVILCCFVDLFVYIVT